MSIDELPTSGMLCYQYHQVLGTYHN